MTPKDDADETTAESTEEADTSEQQETLTGAAQETQQPVQVVTMEDLDQFGEKLIKRMKQSTNDQITSRMKQYDQVVKVQADAGVPIPPESQKLARQAIRDSVLNGDGTEQEPPTEQTGAMTNDQWSEYVANQTLETFKEIGVDVVPGDPEWNAVEKSFINSKTLAAHLRIATKSAEAKKARLASDDDKASIRTTGGRGKPSSALPATVTGHDLFQEAHRKK